jgi:hypothetical protein
MKRASRLLSDFAWGRKETKREGESGPTEDLAREGFFNIFKSFLFFHDLIQNQNEFEFK